MLFPKENSNLKGDCLCKTCKRGFKRGKKIRYWCIFDNRIYRNVGVCKDYEDFKR